MGRHAVFCNKLNVFVLSRRLINLAVLLRQVYKRFIEVGRVGLISHGPDSNKLCTIVDVLDETRVC